MEWRENIGFVTGGANSRSPGESTAGAAEGREAQLSGRLDDLEHRLTFVAEVLADAIEELAAIMARFNGELVRTGAISQQEGIANQDAIGAAVRDRSAETPTARVRPEDGSLI